MGLVFMSQFNFCNIPHDLSRYFSSMCGVAVLVTESRNITAVALIWTSHVFMAAVTSIPRIGKNVFLTTQVTYTILEFLFSYLGEIFAFVVAFHILLPDSESFG